jgi:hypothetical protein
MDPALHGELQASARAAGLSLNEFCVRTLAAPGATGPHLGYAAACVLHARSIVGRGLVAVAGIGSWTRDELFDGSDIDLLVVVEREVELSRDLYRRWDASPPRWNERPVDAHFVQLPSIEGALTGIWAEAAVDGMVLFDRDLALSSRLVRVRHDIADGRIVRRFTHGQPYWAEVA